MILAGNQYKQTQVFYMIAAMINVAVSIATVSTFGLVGVAIGTLVAMVFQVVWESIYLSRNLLRWPLKKVLKQISVDVVTFVLAYLTTQFVVTDVVTYIDWVKIAIPVAIMWASTILIVNGIVYTNNIKTLFGIVLNRVRRAVK